MIKCHHLTFSSKLHYKERGENLDTMEKRTIVRAKKKVNVAKSMLRSNLSYIYRIYIEYDIIIYGCVLKLIASAGSTVKTDSKFIVTRCATRK